MDRSSSAVSTPQPQPGFLGLVTRIVWVAVAPGAMLLVAVAVMERQLGLSYLDAIYWAAALLMIGARLLDVTRLGGTTSDGHPATMATWRRFALVVAGAAVALWGLAHGVAKLLA